MNFITRIINELRLQIKYRRQWVKVLRRTPSNVSIGWNALILGNVQIDEFSFIRDYVILNAIKVAPKKEMIRIGAHTRIEHGCQLYSWGGHIRIGNYCSINPNCIIYGTGGVDIGDYVRMAAGVTIVASSHNFERIDIPIYEQGFEARGIHIGDDVWIGAGVCILDGITIGNGSVVGAGAVVTKSVDPYTIVAGVPAEVIRKRSGTISTYARDT